jgi:L-aspartate semialdehyde sulfurtransferase ferredoxin
MSELLHRQAKCDFCGSCVAVCPHDAIELAESCLTILKDRCTLCMNCVYICPVRALEKTDE